MHFNKGVAAVLVMVMVFVFGSLALAQDPPSLTGDQVWQACQSRPGYLKMPGNERAAAMKLCCKLPEILHDLIPLRGGIENCLEARIRILEYIASDEFIDTYMLSLPPDLLARIEQDESLPRADLKGRVRVILRGRTAYHQSILNRYRQDPQNTQSEPQMMMYFFPALGEECVARYLVGALTIYDILSINPLALL